MQQSKKLTENTHMVHHPTSTEGGFVFPALQAAVDPTPPRHFLIYSEYTIYIRLMATVPIHNLAPS